MIRAKPELADLVLEYLTQRFPRATVYLDRDHRDLFVDHVFIGSVISTSYYPATTGTSWLVLDPIPAADPSLFNIITKTTKELTGL